jgi:hypothetical protein
VAVAAAAAVIAAAAVVAVAVAADAGKPRNQTHKLLFAAIASCRAY